MFKKRLVGLSLMATAVGMSLTSATPAAADVVNLGACQKVADFNQAPGITGNGPLTIVTLPDGRQLVLLPKGFAGGGGCYVKG